MDKLKMKPLKAWTIVQSDGKFDCFDERLPIYWLKRVALKEKERTSFADSRVVRVTVTGAA